MQLIISKIEHDMCDHVTPLSRVLHIMRHVIDKKKN